jgi:hypothetical protein
MAIDASIVVFVGVPDIARITKRTRQRIAQLLNDQDRPNPVLPDSDALINGYPFWSLDSLLPALEAAGYPVVSAVVTQLRSERSVPAGTVPVGALEAVEVLGGIPTSTLASRVANKTVAKPLFALSRNNVWDMDELVIDARARGFAVDDNAVTKWRGRNGSGRPAMREVELVFRVKASVPALDEEAGIRRVEGHVRSVLLPAAPPNPARVQVLEVETQSATP